MYIISKKFCTSNKECNKKKKKEKKKKRKKEGMKKNKIICINIYKNNIILFCMLHRQDSQDIIMCIVGKKIRHEITTLYVDRSSFYIILH